VISGNVNDGIQIDGSQGGAASIYHLFGDPALRLR
jgi:hypothetical protein